MRWVIGFFVLIIGIGIIVGTSSSPNPAVKEASPTAKSDPAADKAMLNFCQKKLDLVAKKTRVLKSYKVDGEYGSVEVRDPYYLQSFDGKNQLNTVILCVMTDGRLDKSVHYVEYLDFRTHREVAKWSDVTGFSMN